MSKRPLRAAALLPAALLIAFLAPACAPLSAMEDVIGTTTGSTSTLYGEVRSVDARRGRIQVREEYGRDHTIRYDGRTQVTAGSRRYPASALERGDIVSVRVQYDRGRELWAERIDVRESRSTRSSRTDDGWYGNDRDDDDRWEDRDRRDDRNRRNERDRRTVVERYDGVVRAIDTRRGYFTLDRERGASLVVYVPRNAPRDDVRRFERLRRNQRVRVEVRLYGSSNRAELVRFR